MLPNKLLLHHISCVLLCSGVFHIIMPVFVEGPRRGRIFGVEVVAGYGSIQRGAVHVLYLAAQAVGAHERKYGGPGACGSFRVSCVCCALRGHFDSVMRCGHVGHHDHSVRRRLYIADWRRVLVRDIGGQHYKFSHHAFIGGFAPEAFDYIQTGRDRSAKITRTCTAGWSAPHAWEVRRVRDNRCRGGRRCRARPTAARPRREG